MKLRLNKILRTAVLSTMLSATFTCAAKDLSAEDGYTNLLLEYGKAYDTVTLSDYGAVTMHYPLKSEDYLYDMRYRTKIDQLNVGGYGGYLVAVAQNVFYGQGALGSSGLTGEVQVNSLSGSGLFSVIGNGTYAVNIFNIAKIENFSGNLIIENESRACTDYVTTFNLTALQLYGGEMSGFIGMQPADTRTSQDRNRIALGISGDVTVGGMNSAYGATYLYSGKLKESDIAHEIHVDIPFEDFLNVEEHVLTIDADKQYTHIFRGKVLGSLSIVMQGEGRQEFVGDMSAFNGSITVNSGTLCVAQNLKAASVSVHGGSFGVDKVLSTSGTLSMKDGVLYAGALRSASGTFSGCNDVATSSLTGTTWTLNVTADNEKSAVVTVFNTERTGRITLDVLDVQYDASQMYNGEYVLFAYEKTLNVVLDDLVLSGDCTSTTIGEKGSADVYMGETKIDGVKFYTILLSVTDGALVKPRDKAVTLTWSADSGVWGVDCGHFDNCWSGDAYNLNFLNGDSVVFSRAAEVTLRGEVNPASMLVNHTDGSLIIAPEDEQASIVGKSSLSVNAPGGVLDIRSDNSFSGGTKLSAGSVLLGHARALGSGKINMSGGALDMGAHAVANALTLNGYVELNGGSAYCGALVLESGSVTGDTLQLATEAVLKSGSVANPLSGSGSISKSGSGTVTLSGDNSYSGGTLVSGGSLVVASDSALGSGSVSLKSGTLNMGDFSVRNDLVVKGSVTVHGAAYAGALTLESGKISGSVLQLSESASLLSGAVALQLTGSAGVVKRGSGSVTLSADNSYSGGTVLESGTLTLNHVSAAGSGEITLQGGTLSLGDKAVANAITVLGDSSVKDASAYSGALTLSSGALKGESIKLVADAELRSGSIANVLKGSASVVKTGEGKVTLSAANSYSGATVVQGGTLHAAHASAFGSSVVELQAGSLDLGGKAVANNLIVDGEAVLLNASAYKGALSLHSGSLSGDSVLLQQDAELLSGTLLNQLSGAGGVLKSGSGSVLLGAANSYSGGTAVQDGTLVAGHDSAFGTGEVLLSGGCLDLAGFRVANSILVTQDAALSGASSFAGELQLLNGSLRADSITLAASSSSLVFRGGALDASLSLADGELYAQSQGHITGDLLLQGGSVVFSASADDVQLTVDSAVTLSADTVFIFDFRPEEKLYQLISFDSWNGSMDSLSLTTRYQSTLVYEFVMQENMLCVRVLDSSALLYWNASKGVWSEGGLGAWVQDGGAAADSGFCSGDFVIINRAATLTIEGPVSPAAVVVEADKSVTFKNSYDKKSASFSGAISGATVLTKRGKGTLTLNDGNSYTGGTILEAGTLKAKGVASFGSGAVSLLGGTLDLAGKAVQNELVLTGDAVVKNGKKYAGILTLTSGTLLKGSVVNVASSSVLQGGTVNGTLSGVGTVSVTGNVSLGTKGKITTSKLDISGKLEVSSKGLSMNSKSSAIVLEGGTLSSAGKISAYSLYLEGGKLDVTNAKPMSITLKGSFSATEDADIALYGGLTANQLTLTNADFTLAMDAADVTDKIKPKAQSISIKGKGVLNTVTDSQVDIAGKMSVTADLRLTDSDVSLHDVAGATKPKAQGMTVKGKLSLEGNSSLAMTGTLSAGALFATDSTIAIAAEDGLAAQNLKLTRKQVVKGVAQENLLTNSSVYVNGGMSVAGNLALNNSSVCLRDYSGKNKAKGLTVKGDLTLDSTSSIVLSGALSAKNLTLGSGSSLTLTASKLSTVKVGGALTLEGAVALDLGFSVSEKDFNKKKAFKIFSFKTMGGNLTLDSNLNELFGISSNLASLSFDSKGKAITLVVVDFEGWNEYVAEVQAEAQQISPESVPVAAVAEEETAEEAPEELLSAPRPVAAAAVDPLLRKAADTLVQSTWGTVNASRAFGDTIVARGAHATLLAEGKGAAWLSTMGSSSRISTDGDRNGADFTLSGAAFGVEGRVTEKSTLGVAIGNSWGKVSTFSAFPVDQDSMHIGIYVNHTLTESLTLSWMATHTRTESELNLLGLPYEWAQDALQLDARLTWATAISDKTTLRVFGGLQYLATDSGESNGLSTGSVQNLRGELGIGASHKCSDSTLVFGELSFVGDMVRNNPTADLGGMRLRGSNPGRAGINLSVGAAHRLSDDWSLNASYSFELMQNVTSHSLNVGASYSF